MWDVFVLREHLGARRPASRVKLWVRRHAPLERTHGSVLRDTRPYKLASTVSSALMRVSTASECCQRGTLATLANECTQQKVAKCKHWSIGQRFTTDLWRYRCGRVQPPQDCPEPAVLIRHASQLLQWLEYLISQHTKAYLLV